MAIINCAILAIVVTLVAISATCLLKLDLQKEFTTPTAGEVGSALILGILAGLANYFASSTMSVLAVVSFVVMIALYCAIGAWWNSDKWGGDKWREMAPFVVLALLFLSPTLSAAAGVVSAFGLSGIWKVLLMRFPICVFVLTVGFFIANMFFFRAKYRYKKEGE